MGVRQAAVAGLFYSADPATLRADVKGHLAAARPVSSLPPKALVVPHAGLVYSGPIAGTAYRTLAPVARDIERVVLLGPTHRIAIRGLAAPTVDRFETPLGAVTIDQVAIDAVISLPQVQRRDDAHAGEHSLEVQLPFLQHLLGDFRLVPFAVGHATADEVAQVLEALWGGPETLVLISSDLSHFHDYATARRLDGATAQSIVDLRLDGLHDDSACGRIPLGGLIRVAQRRQLRAELLDLRNSGDTAGTRDRVVGYGAFAFHAP
jgi:AmmeMemoRadiSam system protein B